MFAGRVSGAVPDIRVSGDVTFANSGNTFSGQLGGAVTTINLGAPNAIPPGVTVSLPTSFGTLALHNFDDTLGNLRGIGNVDLGSGTLSIHLTTQGVFSGRFVGTGTVKVDGAQKLWLDGYTLTPLTLIDDGSTLLLTGPVQHWAGDFVLNAGSTGVLSLTRVGAITVRSGAQLNGGGGPSLPGPYYSYTGSLTFFPGSAFQMYGIGTTPSQFTQLIVTGSVALGSSTLRVNPTVTFPAGTQFVIVDNDGTDPVSGTFDGLPEGAAFAAGGQMYKITYAGSTGNDVVLTVLTQAPTATALTSSPNAAVAGRPVTFTAAVTTNGGAPVPAGTVSFFDGATLLGSAVADGAGVATYSTATLAPGAHSVTAVRSLDANFWNSTSPVVVQSVVADVPALDGRVLIALMLVLAAAGAFALRS
jgi:hypothetical protein